MNTDLYHSHDKLFRETWSDLASARSFLQNYLPGKVLDVARLDTLEICKDSFIEPDLKDYYSDMLYRVEFGESPGYMVKIWRLGQKQGGFGKLSIVVPLVLYHGRSKWRINENFLSGFNGPVESLVEYIPDFRYVLYDLS